MHLKLEISNLVYLNTEQVTRIFPGNLLAVVSFTQISETFFQIHSLSSLIMLPLKQLRDKISCPFFFSKGMRIFCLWRCLVLQGKAETSHIFPSIQERSFSTEAAFC